MWCILSWDVVLGAVWFTFRTGPDTVVLNPSEPSKEKEKQGFFRAIKKKKKKTQMVTCMSGAFDVVSHVWMQYFHAYVALMPVSILYLFHIFNAGASLAPLQKYEVISSICPVHHVFLHQSCSSLLQMQVPEGRPPVIKKCLFPLFNPKNNIKHSSSVRVLPVVSSFMVHAVLHYPTRLLTPCHPSDIACTDNNNQDVFIALIFYHFMRMVKFIQGIMS